MSSFITKKIINRIYTSENEISYDELSNWCDANGYEGILDQSKSLYQALINEHNAGKSICTENSAVMKKAEEADITMLDEEIERLTIRNEKMWIIYDYIKQKETATTIMEVAKWCCQYGYWGVFRKNCDIFIRYITERNKKIA